MGYRTLIAKSIDKAFNAAQDIAKTIVLSSTTKSFNMDTLANDASLLTTKTIKGFYKLKSRKRVMGVSSEEIPEGVYYEIICKSSDLTDAQLYDTIAFDGITCKLVPPYEDNGFTINLTGIKI